ncbi:MAG: hypothetical protein WCL39_11455, partial [Armatimonadota bacterium]
AVSISPIVVATFIRVSSKNPVYSSCVLQFMQNQTHIGSILHHIVRKRPSPECFLVQQAT